MLPEPFGILPLMARCSQNAHRALLTRRGVPAKYEHTTWTAEQLARFLDSIEGERLAAAFVLLATTGMRRGEALGLRWGEVDFAAGRLSIVQTITTVREQMVMSPPKTARSRRSLSLDPGTVPALRDHRRRQNEERLRAGEAWSNTGDLAFTNEVGEPVHPSAFSYLFESCVRRSGLPRIRLHDLRVRLRHGGARRRRPTRRSYPSAWATPRSP
jgi:integrase